MNMDDRDSDQGDSEAPDDTSTSAKPKPAVLLAALLGAVAVVGGGWFIASGGLQSPEERCNAARLEAREAWLSYSNVSGAFQDDARPAIRESLAAHYREHADISVGARLTHESIARGMGQGPGPGPEESRSLADRALRAHATEAWDEVQRFRPAEPSGSATGGSTNEDVPEWRRDDGSSTPGPRWPDLDEAAVRTALAAAIERSEGAYEACRLVDP